MHRLQFPILVTVRGSQLVEELPVSAKSVKVDKGTTIDAIDIAE